MNPESYGRANPSNGAADFGDAASARRDLLAVAGLDGRVRFANRPLRRLLEMRWDRRSLSPVLHPDDIALLEHLDPDAPATLLPLRFRRGTGGWLQVPLACRLVGAGESRRVLAASPSLAAAGPRPADDILRNAPMALYFTVGGLFRYVSPQFAAITGYRTEELLGRRAIDLVLPEDRRQLRRLAARAMAGDRWLQYEYRIRTRQGEVRWLTESVARVRSGDVQATMGTCLDVTERRERADALRDSGRRIEEASAHQPDMLVLTGPAGRFLYLNDAHRQVLGYRTLDLLGVPVQDVVHAQDRERVVRTINGWASRDPLVLELRALRKDGGHVWLESRVELIHEADRSFSGAVIISRDITARRRVEREMRRVAEEIRAPAEALAMFAYAAAQGEAAPLQLVSTFAQVVSQKFVASRGGAEADLFIQGLAGETTRFLALITDLLALDPPALLTAVCPQAA